MVEDALSETGLSHAKSVRLYQIRLRLTEHDHGSTISIRISQRKEA